MINFFLAFGLALCCSDLQVCLEDWWLSKSDGGKGIGVGGRPVEMRR